NPLFGFLPLTTHGRFANGSPYRRCEARQAIFENVVTGARNQELNRRLVTEGAGYHDHGYEGVLLSDHLQRAAPIERRKLGISKNQIGRKLLQSRSEIRPRLDTPRDKRKT